MCPYSRAQDVGVDLILKAVVCQRRQKESVVNSVLSPKLPRGDTALSKLVTWGESKLNPTMYSEGEPEIFGEQH